MKKLYYAYLIILFLTGMGLRADAVCPVTISAGGPVVFCTGDSVLLTASTGVGYLYQWKRNNIAVSGATSQTYYPKTTGNYTVTVTVVSPACTTTSSQIVVTAEAPLTVSITNPGFSMCGASTDLLEAPFGSSYLYQWYEDNNILPNTNSYQINTGHNGNYTVAVTNTCGTYTSPTFVLFDPWLDASPYGTIAPGNSTAFCTGGSSYLYLSSGGGGATGFQWFGNGVALPGETNSYYTATTAGTFVLRTTEYCWWTGTNYDFYSNFITTTLLPGTFPIAVITAAGPTTFCAGSSVTLNADTATGWNYLWRKDGVSTGVTTPSYLATSAGIYNCEVFNNCGSVVSNNILVALIPQTVTITLVGNDTICNGAASTLNASSAGTGGTYQWKLNGSNIVGANNVSYAATVQGSYTCAITNTCGTFTSNVINIIISGTCSTGLRFDGSNDYAKVPRLAATDFGTGNFTLEAWVNLDVIQTATYPTLLSNRVTNPSGFWIAFQNGRLRVSFNSIAATVGPDLRDNACHHIAVSRSSPTVTSLYLDGNLLYTITASTTTVTTNGFMFIGNDYYYSGTSFAALKGNIMEVRMWNVARTITDIQNNRNITLSGTEPGLVGYYRLDDGSGQVINDYSSTSNDGQLGSTASADVNDPVFAAACALSGCTLPPAAITAAGPTTFCGGGSVILNANTGAGLNYQWRRNGILLPGAAGNSYQADTSGSYTCTVINACGSTISNSIAVDVIPVSVTITAVATTICLGADVTLNASNAGTGGAYQWKLNGVNIPGAQSQTYVNSVAGTFTCSITNSCGTFLSNALVMIVDPNCTNGLQFDGSNDRVTITDNPVYNLGAGDFTAEAWIKADASQPFSLPIIFGKRGISGDGFILFLTTGQLSFQVGGINVARAGADLRDNACHHVAVTRTGTTINFYVDGVSVQTQSGYNQSVSSTHPLWIGNDEPNPNPFKGLIHEIRYWNLSRTQSQIVAAKDTLLSGNEPGLIGYWRMNDGSGQSVNDYSTIGNDGFLGSTSAIDANDPSSILACPLTGCSSPAASITAAGPTTFCAGGFVTLNAITGAGFTYQWKLNGGNIAGATASSYAASISGSYSCVVTNSCGSTTSGTITVTVIPATATITAGGSTTFCTGGSVTLNANTGIGFTWQWRLNGGNISGATSSSYVATAAGNYTCAITNVCGTLTSNTITVTVNTPPASTITAGGSTTFCTGGSVTLTANTGAGLTYQWRLNGGNISGATTSSYVATAAGNYTCVVTNNCGGTISNTISVTVNTSPTSTISAGGPTVFCTGGSVALNANTGTGLSYQWMLNGGTISGATTSSYVASVAGNYTAVVTNACGSTTSNTIIVTVNTTSAATITAGGPTTFCTGGSVLLNANTGAGLTYQWRLNGGNIPGATSSAYLASSAGSYTCVVTNGCGNATSNSITVTVNTVPAASISAAGSTTFCNGGSVTLNANTGAGLSYQWQLNGSPVGGATASSFVAGASGSYTCVVTNSCGSITSNSITVTVENLPVATLSALGNTNICAGDSVFLEVTNGLGYNYQYRLNGINIPGATSRQWSASVAGNYTCVVSNSCGNILTNTVTVTVVAGPPAVITAAGSTSFCPGGSVTLNANTGAGLNYDWKRNGVSIPGATASFYSATLAGSYTCLVSYTCGSTLSNSISVTVLSIPVAPGAIQGLSSGICGNTTSYTIASVSGAATYNWTVPAGVTINSGQGTTTLNVTYPIPFAVGSIIVNAENACGISTNTSLGLSSVLAPTGPISGLTVVCDHNSYVYSVAPVPGATLYTWTVPPKAKISQGGQGTPVIQVKISKSGGAITVRASNACATSTTSVLPVVITNINCGPVHRTYGMLDAEVYPNPSSSYFTMKVYSDDDSPCLFILRDMTGRVLERRESIEPGQQLDFGAQVASGIYLVEIQQGEERKVIRVVKNE